MVALSPVRAEWPLLAGLNLWSRGKVRDTYDLGDGNLLVVATDGVSIFDFVLDALVPMKGVVLTAMTVFWFKMLELHGIKTHLVAAGKEIDVYLPGHLQNNPELQSRAIVVRKLKMAPVEFVLRAVLTGSGLKAYNNDGVVCGHRLPEGLQDGDKLPRLLDTPTTKAEAGHDEHIPADQIRGRYPEQTYTAIAAFQIAQAYAERCGILVADTKFELAEDGTLGDEVLTPDSSRFWELDSWVKSRKEEVRKAPPPFDKQLVREAGKRLGIDKLNPENPDHVARVHSMEIPQNIIEQTTQIYRYIFWRLTGMTVERYLYDHMGVSTHKPQVKKVAVICGSESDLSQVQPVCSSVSGINVVVHIASCHRNPDALMDWARSALFDDCQLVIGAGSKALALPGVVDAWFHYFGKNIPVAGVAFGIGQDLIDAQRSILGLPGQPVIFNEMTGEAYTGPTGLRELLLRIREGELPPPKPRKDKPAIVSV